MNEKLEKPSNIKFGIFITVFTFSISAYFFIGASQKLAIISSLFGFLALIITILRPNFLEKINESWFCFGILLGKITSPVIMGAIFFGVIFPVAIIGRLFNRDVLGLKKTNNNSFWVDCEEVSADSFRDQF